MYLTLGLMKAGKSKKLIQQYHASETMYKRVKKVGVFSYKPYEREKFVEVSTRAEGIEPIPYVLNLSKVYLKTDVLSILSEYDLIFIDEIQFAPKEHLEVLVNLSNHKDISCYGLLEDFKGRMFDSVSHLTSVIDKENVIYLEAFCEECGDKATHNIRITNETELFVTDKESYKTVCTKCKEEIEG